jgi:parallel beta-helix repeat protein
MNSSRVLKVVFILVQYTLTIGFNGSGFTTPAVGSYTYGSGSQVQVSATPDSDWVFDHWVLDGSSAGSANPMSVTMSSDHTLSTTFTQLPPPTTSYTVSVSGSTYTAKNPSGGTLYSGSSATTAIQTAINAASTDETVLIKSGTYSITSTISAKSGVKITGEGNPTFDVTHVYTAIGYSGSFTNSRSVTSAVKGLNTATVSSVSGLSIGDLVQISTTSIWKNNPHSFTQGELKTITGINGYILTFDSPLDDTYASSPVLKKANPLRDVIITGIRFIASPGQDIVCLGFSVGYNIVVQGCYFENTYVTAILFSNCINSHALNNTFVNCNSPDEGYGVMFAMASAYCSAEDNVGYVCRHMITIGGYNGEAGIPRHISYLRNKSYDGVINGAFDTHTVGEDIQIIDNEVIGGFNGITFKAYSGLIKGNKVNNVADVGIAVVNQYLISLTIQDTLVGGSARNGITIEAPNVSINNCDITGNGRTGVQIGYSSGGVYDAPNTRLSNSRVTGNEGYGVVIYASNCILTGNTVTGNKAGQIANYGSGNQIS